MIFDIARRGRVAGATKRSIVLPWMLVRQASRRLGWGVVDQAMSSISNFAVNIYIAHTLGAVQYGAFALAYVTYGFALNASRGLGTDPLLVRFSGTDLRTWRHAVASCTGTAAAAGFVAGACALVAAAVLDGTTRMAFLALGLTLPGLLLQDSWRYCFFALGRGSQALLSDTIWTVALIPALVYLRHSGHASVFWFVFAWGATAAVAAAIGPLQAGVVPRLTRAWEWISHHNDLGPRYLAEGTANSASSMLRNYGLGFILGLAAVGYVQAASTLMGPFMVIFFGMGLVMLPEAARVLRRSPRHLPLFCIAASVGLALSGLAWGIVLIVAMPRGLGHLMLGTLWRPTYPLVLPCTIQIMGGCASAGAGTGLHALGAARRSLRAMVLSSALYIVCALVGAVTDGVLGTIIGAAIASWAGAILFWWELHVALRERSQKPAEVASGPRHRVGRHRALPARGRHSDDLAEAELNAELTSPRGGGARKSAHQAGPGDSHNPHGDQPGTCARAK
jgi:O-antigen/teichoic acid export membrane protein